MYKKFILEALFSENKPFLQMCWSSKSTCCIIAFSYYIHIKKILIIDVIFFVSNKYLSQCEYNLHQVMQNYGMDVCGYYIDIRGLNIVNLKKIHMFFYCTNGAKKISQQFHIWFIEVNTFTIILKSRVRSLRSATAFGLTPLLAASSKYLHWRLYIKWWKPQWLSITLLWI